MRDLYINKNHSNTKREISIEEYLNLPHLGEAEKLFNGDIKNAKLGMKFSPEWISKAAKIEKRKVWLSAMFNSGSVVPVFAEIIKKEDNSWACATCDLFDNIVVSDRDPSYKHEGKCKRCGKEIYMREGGFTFDPKNLKGNLFERLASVCTNCVKDEELEVILGDREPKELDGFSLEEDIFYSVPRMWAFGEENEN